MLWTPCHINSFYVFRIHVFPEEVCCDCLSPFRKPSLVLLSKEQSFHSSSSHLHCTDALQFLRHMILRYYPWQKFFLQARSPDSENILPLFSKNFRNAHSLFLNNLLIHLNFVKTTYLVQAIQDRTFTGSHKTGNISVSST